MLYDQLLRIRYVGLEDRCRIKPANKAKYMRPALAFLKAGRLLENMAEFFGHTQPESGGCRL